MTLGLFTAPNPTLELEFDQIKRRRPLPLGVLDALDGAHLVAQRDRAMGLYRESLTRQVKEEFHQRALDLYEKVLDRREEMQQRARVREAIAMKLQHDVAPWVRKERGWLAGAEYLTLGQRLLDARQFGAYGLDSTNAYFFDDDSPEFMWTNRAGLVKLCPDDARWEGRRVGRLYGERLKMLDRMGYVLRYAVFTLPNFPQWHLASGLHAIKKLFYKRLFYARADGTIARTWRDKKRLFPNLVGALCTIEAPLSGRYEADPTNAWHVHLNVLMVFKPDPEQPYGRPDYKSLRDAWGAHVHFSEIPQGDANATKAALKELVKYPLRAISEKSAEDRKPKYDHDGNLLPPAPPMIEWHPACVDEWWQAHKRFRRTWSCGQLYDDEIEALDGSEWTVFQDAPRSPERFEALGPIWLSPASCTVLPPQRDTRELDAAKRRLELEHRYRLEDPEYAAAHAERERRRKLANEHRARRREAADVLLTFIQGNNSARRSSMPVKESSARSRGPPD